MVNAKRPLGFGFPDQILKVKGKLNYFKKESDIDWKDTLIPNFDSRGSNPVLQSNWRIVILITASLIFFFILLLRLFHLQIVEGRQNRDLADGNRIQIRIIHAPRGVIFDKDGQVLAANAPAFRLFDKNTKKARLITRDEALELEVKADPRAKELEIDNVRTYPGGEKFAHVLGYVGEISQDQLKSSQFADYKPGDRIGKTGIEAQYEKNLKGRDGGEIVEVDSKGLKLRTLRIDPPVPGQNVYLTIDAPLQNKLYDLTKDTLEKVGSCCAAVLAQDPKTGKILSLISFPSFDPNAFTNPQEESNISQILLQTDSPILNRAISGTYPPGSTFKIVSSLAALSSSKIDPQTTFVDNGVLYLGTFKFTNWYFNQYGKTEGPVNLKKAIQRSNDTYFYEVGRVVGEQALAEWAKKLKLGQKLNIDLPSEENGLVPDDEWKRKTFGEVWFPGDTLHMAIGQGFVLTSPLQILGTTSFIAADGILYKPQLVDKIVSGDLTIFEYKAKVLTSNIISSDKVQVVKEGLELVPKTGGTAWPFFSFPIATAGKTGTAEFGDPKDRTHAWYTSYAPVNDPKIAMTVLVEGGGEGSSVASPIVKEAYRWYFSPDKNKLIQDVYNQATESGRTLGE